ncbi:phosphotransferase [Leucobacter denitrificans]|uniref:Phosphotransferase n=1 Tax=Leucobacter denitrificans TaxID=683042 RepID=A0A7G9S6V4_9MICO|nr:phosphotransferase [Leucobacter denitrificans]QNN63579.1 phosphotransferase [Leucobacter denitrificans]
MNESEYLPGGSGGVWRIRDADGVTRVHRPTGPWTPAVHELLEHLRTKRLEGIPHVLGFDDEGREVLNYLPGETLDPEQVEVRDAALADAAAWLSKFHRAVEDFEPTSNLWRQGEQPIHRENGEIICHNDPGLYNWVIVDGDFAGMIDWDRAGPGQPIDDLAFLCWSGVPLLRELPLEDVARRLHVAATAYGGVSAAQLLDAVSHRMGLIADRWRVGLENGDPGTLALKESGIMARHEARVSAFTERRDEIRALLTEERADA